MKFLSAILATLAIVFGLTACTVSQSAPVAQPVAPVAQPLDPPTVVTAPNVALASERVAVTTSPAPALAPAQTLVPSYPHEPLPVGEESWEVFAPEYIEYVPAPAPAVALAQPVAQPLAVAPAPALAQPVECLEDMPCWDCATMGNRICGTTEAVLLFAQQAKDPFTVSELATIFHETYIGMHPVATASYPFATVALNSEINPAYEYVFKQAGNYVMGDG